MKISKMIFLAIVLLGVFYPIVQAQQPCNGPDLVAGKPQITREIIGGKGYLHVRSHITNIGTEPFLRPILVGIAINKKWMTGRDAYELFTGYKVSRVDVNQQIPVSGRCAALPGFEKWDCQALITPKCCREVQVIVFWKPINPGDKDCRLDNDQCLDIPENHIRYTSECSK